MDNNYSFSKFVSSVFLLVFSTNVIAIDKIYEAPPSSSTRGSAPYISDEAMERCVVLYNEAKWLHEALERTNVDQYSQHAVNTYNAKVAQHTEMTNYFNINCAGKQSESAYKKAQELNSSAKKINTGNSLEKPSIEQAVREVFGAREYTLVDGKYKTADDELTRLWTEVDFTIEGENYHSKIFVTQKAYDNTPQVYHSLGVEVSAATYRLNPKNSWHNLIAQRHFGVAGSWGDVSSADHEKKLLSRLSFSMMFDAGDGAQGYSWGGKKVFIFTNGLWHDAGFVGTSYSNSGTCSNSVICYSHEGEIHIESASINKKFPDLHVKRYGTDTGGVPVQNVVYKYDGQTYQCQTSEKNDYCPTY